MQEEIERNYGSYYSFNSQYTYYPKQASRLLKNLLDSNQQQFIEFVLELSTKEKIVQLIESIQRLEPLEEGECLQKLFLQILSHRVQQTLIYLATGDQNSNLNTLSNILDCLKMICRTVYIEISQTMFNFIWQQIQNSKNFIMFDKYCSIYCKDTLYRSFYSYGPAFAPKLITKVNILRNNLLAFMENKFQSSMSELKIGEVYTKSSQEEKIIIKTHIIRLIEMWGNQKSIIDVLPKLTEQILRLVKKQNCWMLIKTISQLLPNLLQNIYSILSAQFLNCGINFKEKCLDSPENILCSDIMNNKNILLFIESLPTASQIMNEKNFKFVGHKIYTFIGFEMLIKIEDIILRKTKKINMDLLFTIKNILMKLLLSKDQQLVFIESRVEHHLPIEKYINKIFQIMTKYFQLSREQKIQDIQYCFNLQFMVTLFKNYIDLSLEQNEQKKYSLEILGDLISFSGCYFFKLKNQNIELKQMILKNTLTIIKRLKILPNNWRALKHGRQLIENWVISNQVSIQEQKNLIDIYLDALFDEGFQFTKGVYHFRKQRKPNENYCQYFSKVILKKVSDFAEQLEQNQKYKFDEQENYSKNKFLFKLNLLILGNFKFSTADKITKILTDIYLKYATHLNEIYKLRKWICFHNNQFNKNEVLNLVGEASQKMSEIDFINKNRFDITQYFHNQFPEKIEDKIKEETKLKQLISCIYFLQNRLDLKSQKSVLPKQFYHKLIHQIIKPLAIFCGYVYQKIVQLLLREEGEDKKCKKLIINSLFRKEKSIYHLLFQLCKGLIITIRIYLSNITKMISFPQAHFISSEIGKILIQLAKNERDKLSLLRLLNSLLLTEKSKQKNHLLVSQTLETSCAYTQLKQVTYNHLSHFMSINVVIPLFFQTKDILAFLIANLTQQKRKKLMVNDFNYQYLLNGYQLSQFTAKNQNHKNIISEQITKESALILNKIFLPPISNKKPQVQKLGLYLYLKQIRILLNSPDCLIYTQYHLQKIVRIFQFKNSENLNSKYLLELPEQSKFKYKEPTSFDLFGIYEINSNIFKEETRQILLNFLEIFPQIIYNKKIQKLMQIFSIVNNLIDEIIKFSFGRSQENKLTVDYMYTKLIEKGHKILKQFLENQIALRLIKISNQQDEYQIQKLGEQSVINNKQKIRNQNKRSDSKLYVFFHVLAQIKSNNQKLIKKCFEKNIQIDLLKFLQTANQNQAFQVSQILNFIQETLPLVQKTQNQENLIQVIKYYRLIIDRIQNLKLNNLNFIQKLSLRLLEDAPRFKSTIYPEFGQQIIYRITKLCLKYLEMPNVMEKNKLSQLFQKILFANEGYAKNYFQFNIKNLIRTEYQNSLVLQKQKSEYSIKRTLKPDYIEIDINSFKEFFETGIINYPEIFYFQTRSIFEGWKNSNNTLVYSQGLQNLVKFSDNQKSFISYQVPHAIKELLTKVVEKFADLRTLGNELAKQRFYKIQQAQTEKEKQQINKLYYKDLSPLSKNIFRYLQIIYQILKQNQILIPYTSKIPVKNSKGQYVQFLDFVIDICIEDRIDSMINLFCIFLNKAELFAGLNIMFAQFTAAKAMIKIIKSLRNNKNNFEIINNTVYFATVCLGFKLFNSLSMIGISQTVSQINLFHQMQQLISLKEKQKNFQAQSPIRILYDQCLYLICRNFQVEELKRKNSLIEKSLKNEFVEHKLFFINFKFEKEFKFFQHNEIYENWLGDRSQNEAEIVIKKNTSQNYQIENKQWKNLQDILIYFEKYVNEDMKQTSANIFESSSVSQQINSKKLAQYFKASKKIPNLKYISQKKYKDKKVVEIKQISQIKELGAYYQYLKSLLPQSKFRIHKQQVNFFSQAQLNQGQQIKSIRQSLSVNQNYSIFSNSLNNYQIDNISNKQFLHRLQIIKQNSLKFQEKLLSIPFCKKEENIMMQENILSQREKQLRKNQNYRKIEDMSYAERVEFLINEADEHFFGGLPTSIDIQYRQEATLLRNERERQLNQKRSQREQNKYKRIKAYKKQSKQIIKYQGLMDEQQFRISQKNIVNILTSIFSKTAQKDKMFKRDSKQLNCGINLIILLETKRQGIKYKTLTTLLLLIQNFEKLEIKYYCKKQNNSWEKRFRPVGVQLQAKGHFIVELLEIIKSSLNNYLFDNSELVLKKLQKNNYYSQVLPKDFDQIFFSEQQGNNYSPLIEILYFALDFDLELAGLLIKKSQKLPKILIQKIFKLIKKEKIKQESFYQCLQKISEDQNMVYYFKNNYTRQNPPSFQLLGKIIKFKFGQLPFAKQLHIAALKYYKPSFNEFIKQIFSIYEQEELKYYQQQFKKYKKIFHFLIQELYTQGYNINKSPIYKIVEMPQLLDFKTKKSIFYSNGIIDRTNQVSWIMSGNQLLIDTNNAFATAYQQIMRLKPEELRKQFYIKFSKSTSMGSGMFKTFISLLYDQIFKRDICMFIKIQNLQVYHPNKLAVHLNVDYLNYYKFLGRILGICIIQGQIFPAFFTHTFYKMLINKEPFWKDLQYVNKNMFLIVQSLINNISDYPESQIAELGQLFFCYKETNKINQQIQYQLKAGGKNIQVCNANVKQYIHLVIKHCLIDLCEKQYSMIKEGLDEIIPLEKFRIFTYEDLQKLISGTPFIDKKQFKQVCQYKNFTKDDQEIKWFWKYVEQCNEEELADLVEHFYGLSKLPEGGFANIRVSIERIPYKVDSFPIAKLCGGMTIQLPKYSKYQIMVEQLKKAMKNAKRGQGLMEF